MKKVWLFFLLLNGLFCACNRGQLLEVKKKMEDNVEAVKLIERMRVQLEIDFRNARTFYEAMEKKLYVTSVNTFPDGSYVVSYSDGSEIRLNNGQTSLVTFDKNSGEVLINGMPTGCKPVDGKDGHAPSITIDEDGYYVVDGVRTVLLKGEDGVDGHTPGVSIDDEGFYCLDGERIVPEINLEGKDGQPGKTPVPSMHWNEDAGKHELYIDGQPTDPPTYLSPQDGTDGAPAVSPGRYISQITLSANNELIFTFSDGTTEKSSPVKLSDLSFELDKTKADELAIGQSVSVSYAVYTDYTDNPVSVNQMYSLKGWQVAVVQPDNRTKKGNIVVKPLSGLSESGMLFLMTIDAQQRTVTQKLELSVRPYKISLPSDFKESYVYDVRTAEGVKIAKICREYVKLANKQLTVVYPCNGAETEYGEGFVMENGGLVNFAGEFYRAGTLPAMTVVQLNSGVIKPLSGNPEATVVTPAVVADVEGNKYRTVKIGEQFWMAENLKTTRYSSGQRILEKAVADSRLLGAYCYYDDNQSLKTVYGALYNTRAVQCGLLAPAGWHIPREDEWQELEIFLGSGTYDVGQKLKSEKIGDDPMNGEWQMYSNPGNNLSGFTALPGGDHEYSSQGLGKYISWWMASGEKYFIVLANSRIGPGVVAYATPFFYVRCVKDRKE